MTDQDLWNELPSHAWVSLARRGMEAISLDQCFLAGCDNQDHKLLEPFKMEKEEEKDKEIKRIYIKCKKCNRIFQIKLETLKKVAKPTNADESDETKILSMGLVYALDENGKNLGHIGYF